MKKSFEAKQSGAMETAHPADTLKKDLELLKRDPVRPFIVSLMLLLKITQYLLS